jgi:Helitron helicase-like domain at N-terminus/PIF1-like helicase
MSLEEIIKKINESIRACYLIDRQHKATAIVCLVCDRFIKPCSVKRIGIEKLVKHKKLFKANREYGLHQSIREQYKIKLLPEHVEDGRELLSNCMLSPRSEYIEIHDQRNKSGYTICTTCNNFVTVGKQPIYSISNNFAFGKTPKCLSSLTPIELAMITPVRTFGYCFSYTGGKQQQIKGSLSYYKIATQTVVETGARFESLGLNDHVVIMLYGSFTIEQRNKVLSKCEIRTLKIIKAISWLVRNNKQWQCYRERFDELRQNMDSFKSSINQPLVHEDYKLAEANDNDVDLNVDKRVEDMETFQVFYPDGTVTTLNGGQQNMYEFQQVVKTASEQGLEIQCRMKVISKAVYDFKDDNLVNACLLQFPYGRGGLNEKRQSSENKTSKYVDLIKYTQYISLLSLPQFQIELFTLQLYNMQMKYWMLESATWQLRNKAHASVLSSPFSPTDVYDSIDLNRRGICRGNSNMNGGQVLLGAVDAICKRIPHTNEATKRARRDIETMQHHFGSPTFFLTVTPDDDNHILVQIYSDEILTSLGATDRMNDDEVFALSTRKKALRIKNPGVTAYFFELMIDILFRDVIGWDKVNKTPIPSVEGIFGKVTAVTMSIEEQGRRTLHAHILLWVSNLNKVRTDLFSNDRFVVRTAKDIIISKIDDLCSTKFVFNGEQIRQPKESLNASFPHVCIEVSENSNPHPIAAADQQIRNLRCKRPHSDVAYHCQNNCCTEWSSKQFVTSYLQNHVKLPHISNDYAANIRRLKNKTSEFQLAGTTDFVAPRWMVDVPYNHHNHCDGCFKYKANQHSKSNMCDECRYRNPQKKRRTTVIIEVETAPQPWYLWTGEKTERPIMELNMKRSQYDMFQNICCPYIAYSKFTCNNNLSFVLPGPIAQYCTSYIVKNTQKDEVKAYEAVRTAADKMLSVAKENETPRNVALRRLLSSSFTHQSENIVGAAMASYLTRNGSRFYFSHDNVWCPLRDIEDLLNGNSVTPAITIRDDNAFFKCEALNYLCRPTQLESLSAFEFYSKYEITKFNKDDNMQFQNTNFFKHPSYCEKKNKFRQGIVPRTKSKLTKVIQYDIPDTAMFEGNILNQDTSINESMERYSLKVLLLFFPYRQKSDILPNEFYTEHLRHCVAQGLIPEAAFTFLQNLQDTKANNLRNMLSTDDLQRNTDTPQTDANNPINNRNEHEDEDEDDDEEEQLLQLRSLAELSDDIDQYINGATEDEENCNDIPLMFQCTELREKGGDKCGSEGLPDLANLDIEVNREFVATSIAPNILAPIQDQFICRENPTQDRLVAILICQNQHIQKSFGELTGQQDTVTVLQANGSVKSIRDWSQKSNLDITQGRAFEVIVGSFVLSFYDSAPSGRTNARSRYSNEKKKLEKLVHRQTWKNNQLICFLHGPGGSGKSALIDLVLLYTNDYCSYLWSGFQSTERVVVVTAMTGVAATILQGETTHSALYLNQQKPLEPNQIDLWARTRMLIIDEISFADKSDICKIDTNLCKLKQQSGVKYGGINIVFCGDLRQLEPVGYCKKPLYEENVVKFKDWINCYVELNGIWRFKNDPAWGQLLSNMRNGVATLSDISVINSQLKQQRPIPPTIRYACYFNKEKAAINTAIFHERIKHSYKKYETTAGYILIFADGIQMKDISKVYQQFGNTHLLYQSFSENDLKFPKGSGKMDFVLKLFSGCPVMIPSNINVAMGQANGTQATVRQIVLKPNVQPTTTLLNGKIPVAAVFASQVEYIELKHSNSRVEQQIFHLTPKSHTFKLNLPTSQQYILRNPTFIADLKATQLPILQNSATTGHKLQGSGVETLYVHKWSNVTNWNYVMLSRVKKMDGLYARHPLPEDMATYKLKPSYQKLISKLATRPPIQLTEEEYALITS